MSEQSVLSLLCYSMMSYGENFRSDVYRRIAFVDCKKSGVQYYIGQGHSECLIAFRGTDSNFDLIHDLMFFKRAIPGINMKNLRVHSGFLRIYQRTEIRERIMQEVLQLNLTRIYITGHSLGAALAILCALDLASSKYSSAIRCVVFGSPRVGNLQFARAHNGLVPDTLRIECGNDAICKLPPAIFGYRHVGTSLQIGAKKIPFIYSFQDHDISEYFSNLISARKRVGQ